MRAWAKHNEIRNIRPSQKAGPGVRAVWGCRTREADLPVTQTRERRPASRSTPALAKKLPLACVGRASISENASATEHPAASLADSLATKGSSHGRIAGQGTHGRRRLRRPAC